MINISKGDRVLVHIPDADIKAHRVLAKYNGQEMEVSRRITHLNGQKVYYELDGAKSEYGIPFGFVREWLVQL